MTIGWRTTACAVVFVFVLGACSAGSDDGADRRSGGADASGERRSSVTVASVEGASVDLSVPVEAKDAAALLSLFGERVPVPPDAMGCVAVKLAKDPALVAELKATKPAEPVPDGVLDLGAGCMQELHAAPAFVEHLDGQVDGGLNPAQRRCVTEGFLALDPAVVEAAIADAVGATKAAEKAGPMRTMLRSCGVKAGN